MTSSDVPHPHPLPLTGRTATPEIALPVSGFGHAGASGGRARVARCGWRGTGARYEWMSWDAAWRRESWPV